MDIKIWYHSCKDNRDCKNHIREIAKFLDMPNSISINCEIMWSVDFSPNNITVTTNDMPFRIDYDKYLRTLHILNKHEASYCRKPYSLLPEKKQAVTLWEYGERELTNIEEGCLLSV